MTEISDEVHTNGLLDWDDLKGPTKIDKDFEKLGANRLNKLVSHTEKRPAEVSHRLNLTDRDLISKLIRRERYPTRHALQRIAKEIVKLLIEKQKDVGLNTLDLVEIELSLHYGILPRHVLELPSRQGSEILLPALRDIINSIFVASQDPQQDLQRSKYWLDKFGAQMRAWGALIHFTQKWRYAEEWHEIEDLWDKIQREWSLMNAEQRGWAAILRAQTLKLRGLTHDALGFLEFAQSQFPEEFEQPGDSPTRLIRYNLYITWGDAYREIGRLSDALKAYDRAAEYSINSIERFRLDRKKFDTYNRVSKEPTSDLLSKLEAATNHRYIIDQGQTVMLDDVEYAHTCYALAWYWRIHGLGTLGNAKNYIQDGLSSLTRESGERNPQAAHVQAIGHQYHAETLLRLGQFELAMDEANQSVFLPLHHARRAFSKYIFGRAYAYHAFSKARFDLLNEAILSLENAEDLYSLMGTSQRRSQVLIELAKFYAIRPSLRGDKNLDETDFSKAQHYLSLAETILKALATFKIHSEPAVKVNQAIVNFLIWITNSKKKGDKKEAIKIRSSIDALKRSLHKGGLSGHLARALALSAAFRLASAGTEQRDKEWKKKTLEEVKQSANLANQSDMMVLYDCRWLISLGGERSRLLKFFPLQDIMNVFDQFSDQRLKDAPNGAWAHDISHRYANF